MKHEEFQRAHAATAASTTKKAKKSKTLYCQTLTPDSLKAAQKYKQHSKKWNRLADDITYCIGKDMQPIYTVEKPGFINLLGQFDPQYELPGRKYFTKIALPQLYVHARQSVLHAVTGP